ncbi:MAG: pyridoxal-dependent decarboxylase [Planctomycetota bacterium]|nr:pyridoxal-dependent decarboxylase [Planctomycetota bacterium]
MPQHQPQPQPELMPKAMPEPQPEPIPHMAPEEFRRLGERLLGWIADYWTRVEGLPVASRAAPGDVLRALPEFPPEAGEDLAAALLADLERIVLPGLTHWQHPMFFGFFPANISAPSVLGELLSAGLGVQGMLWATSPACTELEMRALDWLGHALGLPDAFLFRGGGGGVIDGTASEAVVSAITAARHRALRALSESSRRDAAGRLTLYTSTQAHSSIVKGAMVTGLALDAADRARVRLIDTDPAGAMDADALARAIDADRAAGLVPFFVSATLGTTGATAVDPLASIARVLARPPEPRPWLHVDAAHAGAMLVCPEFRSPAAGVEHADSFTFNPHKWLLTNFDCNCLWTRDPASLTASLSIVPEYLRNAASDAGSVVDYRDWHVPLGRRFRALKLWLVMRHYGLAGLRAYIREHVRLAGLVESWVRIEPRLELAAPRTMNLVVFRPTPRPGESPGATDARARALLDRLNASGKMYLTHTTLPPEVADGPPRFVLRLCIGAVSTREEHVREAWRLILDALE